MKAKFNPGDRVRITIDTPFGAAGTEFTTYDPAVKEGPAPFDSIVFAQLVVDRDTVVAVPVDCVELVTPAGEQPAAADTENDAMEAALKAALGTATDILNPTKTGRTKRELLISSCEAALALFNQSASMLAEEFGDTIIVDSEFCPHGAGGHAQLGFVISKPTT